VPQGPDVLPACSLNCLTRHRRTNLLGVLAWAIEEQRSVDVEAIAFHYERSDWQDRAPRLSLGIGLAVVKACRVRPLLVGSVVLSLLVWCVTEAFGQLLTGTATDVNTGPLLVLLALACWPAHRPSSTLTSVRYVAACGHIIAHDKSSEHRVAA
jgi:hypothetical protein